MNISLLKEFSFTLRAVITLFMLTTATICNGQELFSGGNGSKEHPYLISTKDDLMTLSDNVNGGESYGETNHYFRLTNDIDFGNKDFTPIGHSKVFRGELDGGGYTVKNIRIEESKRTGVGFFGQITEGCVRNLTLENVKIISNKKTENYTGVIVGKLLRGSIINCTVRNSVIESSYQNVGGIVGYAEGSTTVVTISDCTADSITLKGTENIGGICGNANNVNKVSINNCKVSNLNIVSSTAAFAGNICGKNNYFYSGKDVLLYTDKWNLVARLGNTFDILNTNISQNNIAAVAFDYNTDGMGNGNTWSSNYLYADDKMNNCEGYFVWVFSADTAANQLNNSFTFLSPEYLLDSAEVIIPKIINNGDVNQYTSNGSKEQSAHWFALGNPFKTTLQAEDILNNIPDATGGVVYVYYPNLNRWKNPDTVKAGEGFVVAGVGNELSGKIVNKHSSVKSKKEEKTKTAIILTCAYGENTKDALIIIDSNAKNGFDTKDAFVLPASDNLNLAEPYFLVDNKMIMNNVIKTLPYSCPLNIYSARENTVELTIKSNDPTIVTSIIDLATQQETVLDEIPYPITADKGNNAGKYLIKLTKAGLNTDFTQKLSDYIEIKCHNKTVTITGEALESMEVYNTLGRRVLAKTLHANNYTQTLDLTAGMYIIKVKTQTAQQSQKIIIP